MYASLTSLSAEDSDVVGEEVDFIGDLIGFSFFFFPS